MYTGQEKLLYINKSIEAGRPQYSIVYTNSDKERSNPISIEMPLGKFDRNTIINALVRSKFSQDQVEAITNNRLLDICEYFDILKNQNNAKANSFLKNIKDDKDYQDLQAWRATCKKWADEILEKYK